MGNRLVSNSTRAIAPHHPPPTGELPMGGHDPPNHPGRGAAGRTNIPVTRNLPLRNTVAQGEHPLSEVVKLDHHGHPKSLQDGIRLRQFLLRHGRRHLAQRDGRTGGVNNDSHLAETRIERLPNHIAAQLPNLGDRGRHVRNP